MSTICTNIFSGLSEQLELFCVRADAVEAESRALGPVARRPRCYSKPIIVCRAVPSLANETIGLASL